MSKRDGNHARMCTFAIARFLGDLCLGHITRWTHRDRLFVLQHDKDFPNLAAQQQLHTHRLTGVQVLGIARQLFEACSSDWQDRDWKAACDYLTKTSGLLDSIMWDFLLKRGIYSLLPIACLACHLNDSQMAADCTGCAY